MTMYTVTTTLTVTVVAEVEAETETEAVFLAGQQYQEDGIADRYIEYGSATIESVVAVANE